MKNNATPFYKDAAAAVDAGLRKYMLNVFSYMSAGLAISAIVAYFASTSPAIMAMFFSSIRRRSRSTNSMSAMSSGGMSGI